MGYYIDLEKISIDVLNTEKGLNILQSNIFPASSIEKEPKFSIFLSPGAYPIRKQLRLLPNWPVF